MKTSKHTPKTSTAKFAAARVARGAAAAPKATTGKGRRAKDAEEEEEDEDTGPVPYAHGKPAKTSKAVKATAPALKPEKHPPYVRGYAASVADNLKDILSWANTRRAESLSIASAHDALKLAHAALLNIAGEEA